MDTNITHIAGIACVLSAMFSTFGDGIGVAVKIDDRTYCRTNTWNGCCSFANVHGTKFWKWKAPQDEILPAIYAARHYARHGRNTSVPLDYYHEPLGKTSAGEKSWRLNFNQFPPPTSNCLVIDGKSVSLTDMDVRTLPFEVTNPGSKSSLRCVLVEFSYKGKFCFAVYVNVNTGRTSLDFHELADSGWMLIASESRYPYLTPDECEIQSQVYLRNFFKKDSPEPFQPHKSSRDEKTEQPSSPQSAFDLDKDIEVSI